ncbi:hypothetical protein KW805_03160 [Candidatus Pacearchaeota archaeon]|nr:hypothetical protein [Candidatus Pacearchaeota archaeon]
MTLESKLTPEGLPVVSSATCSVAMRDYKMRKTSIELEKYFSEKIEEIGNTNPNLSDYIKHMSNSTYETLVREGAEDKYARMAKILSGSWLVMTYDMLKRQAEVNQLNSE